MGITSGLYKILLLLHILTAVVGIGAVSLNGLYGREAKQRQGTAGLAVAEASDFVSHVAGYVIYMIPIFGILLVMASDGLYSMGDLWISLSLGLFVVALGISHGVVQPNSRKMIGLMRELSSAPPVASGGPPPQVAELERRGRTLGIAGASLNLLLVVFVALMIWKPGA